MSEAVILKNAYKKFAAPSLAHWKRLETRSSGRFDALMQETIALDHLSFSVGPAEIFGIVGSPGAGKSTLIRMLAASLFPDSGEVRVFGYDVVWYPKQVQRLVNRVSVEASFFKKLSPLDNLLYGMHPHGARRQEMRRQVIETLERLELDAASIYQPMQTLPGNMQQKVFIARALLSRPRLLLLDEPTRGLGRRGVQAVHQMLRELRQELGVTILFTTSDVSEAEAVCDRVAILDAGRLVYLGAAVQTAEQARNLESIFLGANLVPQVCEV